MSKQTPSSAYKQNLSSACKQNAKQGHKHVHVRTDGLTKKLLTLSSYLTFVNVREVSANA